LSFADFEIGGEEKEAKVGAVEKNSLEALKAALREKALNAGYLMERRFSHKYVIGLFEGVDLS